MSEKNDITYKQEILRKAIHLNSISIPVIYSFITRELALQILIPLTLAFLIVDLLSSVSETVKKLVHFVFGRMLRPHETGDKLRLNGATWVLLSATLCVFVFPKLLAITGFSILIISDLSAALIGRKFGRHKLFSKSWEGTSAFFVTAFMVITVIGILVPAPPAYFIFGYLGAIAGGFAEAASAEMKMDDNLSITVRIAFVMWAGNYIAEYFNYSGFVNLM